MTVNPVKFANEFKTYNGNPNLKRSGVHIEWTPELVQEYVRCSQDPIYFVETYMKIVNVDRGLIPFEMYPYQKTMINSMVDNRYTIITTARQAGKSSTATAFLLWYVLFNDNKTVALLANKGETAREILGKVELAYQHLPKWLQQGVIEWNKGSLSLENGSRVIATATSGDSVRGFSLNCVDGSTKITLRDKETGFINILSIDELKLFLEIRSVTYGFVYITRNIINDKKYIGIHRKQKKDHYLGSGKAFKRALKKYGKENFEQKIVSFANSEDELIDLERQIISEHNAVNDDQYYNISHGGTNPILCGEENGFYGRTHTLNTRQKLSDIHKGKLIPEEQRIYLSGVMKDKWKDKEYREKIKFRKPRSKFTEEQKLEASKRAKGRKCSESVKKIISEKMIKKFKEPEYKEKFTRIQQNRNNDGYKTEEFKQQARERMIQWNKSPEKKKLNTLRQTGKPLSQERKENISKALKRKHLHESDSR